MKHIDLDIVEFKEDWINVSGNAWAKSGVRGYVTNTDRGFLDIKFLVSEKDYIKSNDMDRLTICGVPINAVNFIQTVESLPQEQDILSLNT